MFVILIFVFFILFFILPKAGDKQLKRISCYLLIHPNIFGRVESAMSGGRLFHACDVIKGSGVQFRGR